MAVTRLDKIAGTHLSSIVHTEDLLNGNVVALGELVDDETETYKVYVPTEDIDLTEGEILLHATPEVDADPRKAGLKHFVLSAGTEGRAYHPTVGDIVTLTKDLIDGTPTVGEYITPQLKKLKLIASADGTVDNKATSAKIKPRLQMKVIQKTILGYDASEAYAVRVIKA